MATYELCVNGETAASGGEVYETLEQAITAGEAAITPDEREDIPMIVDPCVFFTGHERDSGAAWKDASRWSPRDTRERASSRDLGVGGKQPGYPGRHV